MSKTWEETVKVIQKIGEHAKRGGSYEEMAKALGAIEYIVDEWYTRVAECEKAEILESCPT